MTEPSVDELRKQLSERGYLTHGIERWFALDPWKSRAFWIELLIVALKAGVLAGGSLGVMLTAIMLLRNDVSGPLEITLLFALYSVVGGAVAALVLIALALLMKSRPEIAVDRPAALFLIAVLAATAVMSLPVAWWRGFEEAPQQYEVVIGALLLAIAFAVTVIATSAALLSFSIYELQRVPAVQRTSRLLPIALVALGAALLALGVSTRRNDPLIEPPAQVLTSPTRSRVALLAVDGLTEELLRSRPSLAQRFLVVHPVEPLDGSTAERWASVGTGVDPRLHGVHSIEGFRLAKTSALLQSVSAKDIPLRLAASAGIAYRQPMPPSARRRDFVWEIIGSRGIPTVSVNWWTAPEIASTAAVSVSQAAIFTAAKNDALRVDASAASRLLHETAKIGATSPALITAYFPALDIILNRSNGDNSAQVAGSLRALTGIEEVVNDLSRRGFAVVLVGMPGDSQNGSAVFASTLSVQSPASLYDVVPTICYVFGFPASQEMTGASLAGRSPDRIASYGSRRQAGAAARMSEEYYESLRALGYIQ